MNDLKFAVRQLLKNPGFTAVAVLTLALGIGANTAIFSFVNAVLLRPLPYGDIERIVHLSSQNLSKGTSGFGVSVANFEEWKQQSASFEALAYYRPIDPRITSTDQPEEINGARVSEGFFRVLGVPPLLGRAFLPEEDVPENNHVAVLSHTLWLRKFGGDPDIVGKTVDIESKSHLICGVMPSGFTYPEKSELWQPYGAEESQRAFKRNDHMEGVIGLVKEDISIEQMEAEMDTIASRLETQYPDANTNISVLVRPLSATIVGAVKPALVLLFAAVCAVLLIACANVAHLQLARSLSRQKELTVRAALGASRARIVRQLLTESLLLSGAGALLALLVAKVLMVGFAMLAPGDVPRIQETRLDGTVLAFTCIVALLCGIAFGILPALQASKVNLTNRLNQEGRSSTGGRAQQRTRGLLVIGEIAAAVVLLIGAILFLRSFHALENVPLGFRPADTFSTRIRLPWDKYHPAGLDVPFFKELRERLSAKPGFQEVGMVCVMPTTERGVSVWIKEPGTNPKPGEDWLARWNYATPGYFDAMGIPLLRGRDLHAHDTADSALVMVITEPLAQRYFPNEDPLGKQLQVEGQDEKVFTVVGVVGGVRNVDLTIPQRAEIYFSYQQVNVASMWLVAKTDLPTTTVEKIVAAEVHSLDPAQPIRPGQCLTEQLSLATKLPRFRTLLLSSMATFALFLAVIGIYSLVSYNVFLQRKDIGVRMALGAQAGDILRLVLSQGAKLVAIGAVCGITISLGTVKLLGSMLYGIQPTDRLTFVTAIALIIALTLIACWLPARRAAQVDPMEALRSE